MRSQSLSIPLNIWYQLCSVYFSPYRALFSFQYSNSPLLLVSMTYTTCFNLACRYALTTSHCLICSPLNIPANIRVRQVKGLIIWAYVLSQLILYCCENPCSTFLALYFLMLPSECLLTLYTHLVSMIFVPSRMVSLLTIVYTPYVLSYCCSCCGASNQSCRFGPSLVSFSEGSSMFLIWVVFHVDLRRLFSFVNSSGVFICCLALGFSFSFGDLVFC